MNPLFAHAFRLSCDDVDYVVWCGLWYVEVNHEGTGRRRVRRVDTGELEVVDLASGRARSDGAQGDSGDQVVGKDGGYIGTRCPVLPVVRHVGRASWR